MVRLRELLQSVAAGYSAADGGSGQEILQSAPTELETAAIPAGWVVRSSRRIGQFTHTPWLGFFDPDETVDPKEGLYVCWIFEPDLQHVVLTIQQGTESLTKDGHGGESISHRLTTDAQVLRDSLEPRRLVGLTEQISFGPGTRQRRYAAGSVAHTRYRVGELPPNDVLLTAHQKFCELLGDVIAARDTTLRGEPGVLNQSAPVSAKEATLQLEHFKPKSSDDYIVQLTAARRRQSRRHEGMVNSYADWASQRGWVVASPHPVDLRLRKGAIVPEGADAWRDAVLFEAKVLRRGNATAAVREAIGQLMTYPPVVVPEQARRTVRKAALFSESIGDLWLTVLEEELGVATVWWQAGIWAGGQLATSLELVDDTVS